MMMILSFVVTCLVSLRALRLRTLVIHSIIVIHSSPHCVDARFALASLALLIECAQFVSCTPCPHCVDARLRCSRTHLTYVSFGMVLGPVAHGVDADVDPYLSAFRT